MPSPNDQLISVIVPVFNENDRIVENLDLLISEVEDHFQSWEIVVVSDGSTDGTNFKVFQFKYPGLHVVIADHNQGKGAAVRTGFQRARGDFIFFIDGGMELHPKELPIFFGLMALYQADMVIGSKRHPQSQVYYPWFRKLLSFFYQMLIRRLFNINVTDTQVGMKLFRRDVVRDVLPLLKTDRYGFDLEILSMASLMGYKKILEAPVTMDYFAKNKRPLPIELWHVFRVGLSLLKDTIRLYRRVRRLRQEVERTSREMA